MTLPAAAPVHAPFEEGIPTLDMGPFERSNASTRARIADELATNFRDIGFVSITGHGVDKKLLDRAFALAEAVFVSKMTIEERLRYEFPDEGRQMGFTPAKKEKSIGQQYPNNMAFWHVNDPKSVVRNEFPTEVAEFGPVMLQVHAAVKKVGIMILRALAIHLGRDPEFFTRWAETGENLLRVIHYPALTGEEKEPRSGAHTDINLVTVLVPASQPGLQVRKPGGKWINAHVEADALVVNMGDMFQMHTFGEFPSTEHQVVNPGTSCEDRFSMPLFVHPPKDVTLVSAGAYKFRRLREIELFAPLPPNQIDY